MIWVPFAVAMNGRVAWRMIRWRTHVVVGIPGKSWWWTWSRTCSWRTSLLSYFKIGICQYTDMLNFSPGTSSWVKLRHVKFCYVKWLQTELRFVNLFMAVSMSVRKKMSIRMNTTPRWLFSYWRIKIKMRWEKEQDGVKTRQKVSVLVLEDKEEEQYVCFAK
jgi:hypothetical protein